MLTEPPVALLLCLLSHQWVYCSVCARLTEPPVALLLCLLSHQWLYCPVCALLTESPVGLLSSMCYAYRATSGSNVQYVLCLSGSIVQYVLGLPSHQWVYCPVCAMLKWVSCPVCARLTEPPVGLLSSMCYAYRATSGSIVQSMPTTS